MRGALASCLVTGAVDRCASSVRVDVVLAISSRVSAPDAVRMRTVAGYIAIFSRVGRLDRESTTQREGTPIERSLTVSNLARLVIATADQTRVEQ